VQEELKALVGALEVVVGCRACLPLPFYAPYGCLSLRNRLRYPCMAETS